MLQGRTAIVTGASSGIGLALARSLAASGAGVAVAARRLERCQALADELSAEGAKACAVQVDVTDETSVARAFGEAEDALGPIDTVYANAGAALTAPVLDMAISDFDSLMAVNVRGAFLTAREGARRMMANGAAQAARGRIVLIASIGGVKPLPGVAAYSISKAAVVMMAKSLALEWARSGVNVNAVCPGYISTELNKDFLESESGQKMVGRFPRRRLMQTDDLMGLLLLLGSDRSRAMTGGVHLVDDAQAL